MIMVPKTEPLRLQNATPLRKSAPGPPNSSDEHVSCTSLATENASLQILFKCPTPAIVFGNATIPSRLAPFCACHAKRHLNVQKWREHVVRFTCSIRNVFRATTASIFSTFFCPSPLPFGGSTVLSLTRGPAENRTTTGSLSATQECRDTNCTTRTTTASIFSTSQLPKVVQEWCALYILTSKCASHNNGVHFFDMATSKTGPIVRCL